MASTKTPRPPAVSSACLFVGIGSALLLMYVVGWLSDWDSLEMQDAHGQIADALAISDVDRVADVLRYGLYVLVVVLVAGLVGAIYTARGDLASRVLVTVVAAVVAVLFVLSGGVFGLIPGAFSVAAIVQLWGRDARRWFALVNGRSVPSSTPSSPFAPPPGSSHLSIPPPPPAGYESASTGSPIPPPPMTRRPASVRTTIVVTAIASGLALAGALFYLAVFTLVPRDELVDLQLDSPFTEMVGLTEDDIRQALTTSAVFCGVTAILAAASLLAVWALALRKRAGHAVLFVCAVVSAAVGIFSLVGIPWAVAAVWVAILLRR
ncbi:MAG TPA: hypothetical protein VNZ66_07455, partial [Aeromicrobium sp.]|nr:hypothetical protein [Aeromicrobium sp.]